MISYKAFQKIHMTNVTINRISREDGDYSSISNQLLFNEKLHGDSIRLLSCILNNKSNSNLVLYHYSTKFKWSEYLQSRIIKNLEENGYLRKKKKSKGRSCFEYHFEICEKGSLLNK